jgi:hypothetical protein
LEALDDDARSVSPNGWGARLLIDVMDATSPKRAVL